MTLKTWVLGRLQQMNGLVGRVDLPARERAGEPTLESAHESAQHSGSGPGAQTPNSALSGAEHLGAYGPLISAVRDELEHFVASHVRLHLAIAERDSFLLTSIGVRCAGAFEAHALLQQFMREFKPEQVKRYLSRDVIGGLANASAIDLSQFAGLFDADARDDADNSGQGGEYRELLEALRSTPTPAVVRPYQVSVVGRWIELDFARPAAAQAHAGAAPTTPLAGQRCEFDIEDGDGRRRVVLQAVVPGRRYVIGKGEGCDIRINGTYASRRHAEVWLDSDAWWVNDAGSTNGIRIESPAGVVDRSGGATAGAGIEQPIKLTDGARIVLSARAEGPASEYPWVAMRPSAHAATRITPIAATTGTAGSPRTPLTAIMPTRAPENLLKITAVQVAGVRTLELRPGSLPVTVGRSRNQSLMVDRRHEGVSGHHLEITELDESGAQGVVHGDNGVLIEGVHYATGARFHWRVGEAMVLGASPDDHPTCTMTLTRDEKD